jgi:hypothetical protein
VLFSLFLKRGQISVLSVAWTCCTPSVPVSVYATCADAVVHSITEPAVANILIADIAAIEDWPNCQLLTSLWSVCLILSLVQFVDWLQGSVVLIMLYLKSRLVLLSRCL